MWATPSLLKIPYTLSRTITGIIILGYPHSPSYVEYNRSKSLIWSSRLG